MPSARSTVSTSRRRVRRQEPRLGDARILETGHFRGAWQMRTTRSKQRGRPMPAQYRQGDVLLCRVSKVHSGSPVPPDAGGRLVIAEGEHSGHAHALAPERAQLFRRGRQLLLSVGADGTALSHEEHRQIRIAVEQAVAEALACVGALNGGWPAVAIDLARRRMLEEWAKQPAISMSEEQSRAEKYRREAAEIRSAAEIVRDEGFRQQLLSIADEYDAVATSIEVKIGPNE